MMEEVNKLARHFYVIVMLADILYAFLLQLRHARRVNDYILQFIEDALKRRLHVYYWTQLLLVYNLIVLRFSTTNDDNAFDMASSAFIPGV